MTTKNSYLGLMAAAAAAWPEDEAALTADSYNGCLGDANDCTWAKECAVRDIAHMHKVFSRETDSAELIARYDAALIAAGVPEALVKGGAL